MNELITMQDSLEIIGLVLTANLTARGIKTKVANSKEFDLSQTHQYSVDIPWNTAERTLSKDQYKETIGGILADKLAEKIETKQVTFIPLMLPKNDMFEKGSFQNEHVAIRGITAYEIDSDKLITRYDILVADA